MLRHEFLTRSRIIFETCEIFLQFIFCDCLYKTFAPFRFCLLRSFRQIRDCSFMTSINKWEFQTYPHFRGCFLICQKNFIQKFDKRSNPSINKHLVSTISMLIFFYGVAVLNNGICTVWFNDLIQEFDLSSNIGYIK